MGKGIGGNGLGITSVELGGVVKGVGGKGLWSTSTPQVSRATPYTCGVEGRKVRGSIRYGALHPPTRQVSRAIVVVEKPLLGHAQMQIDQV